MKLNIKEKLINYKRILTVAKKPAKEDFLSAAKISAIGMLIIGIIGLIVYAVAVLTGI